MDSDQNSQIRRKSMYGTALLALGIMAAISSVATGSVWLVGAAGVFLVLGLVLLCQVGKSLSRYGRITLRPPAPGASLK